MAFVIIANDTIEREQEAETTDFLHHSHIPELMARVPQIESVSGYEEYNIDGLLRFYRKQCLTIYEVSDGASLEDFVPERRGDSVKPVWEPEVYCLRYLHPMNTTGSVFGRRPFFA